MTKTVYGDIPLAQQRIGFGQLTWDKKLNKHDYFWNCLALSVLQHTHAQNRRRKLIPSLFAQDEIALMTNHKILLGGLRLQ
jgi:outer membrane receptor for ferrienterochelin and colicins